MSDRSVVVVRVCLAVAVGFAVGAATEWSVPHLPFSLEPVGNSAAPWIIAAFAVALSARRVVEALGLAVVALIASVLGFYLVEAWRGWEVFRHQVVFWSVTSVVVGPLVGAAAGSLRHGGRTIAALGAGVLGGLLVGESVYGLRELRFSSPARYWHVQLVVGATVAVIVTVWRSRNRLDRAASAVAASLAACAFVALGTLVAYQVI